MITKCLIVDDIQENLIALEAMLKGEKLEVHKASSGDKALDLMLQHDYAFALLDVQMPGMGGLELAEFMRGTEKTKNIPIIFVTADPDKGLEFKGYDSGAVDVLYKPLNSKILLSKIRVFAELDEKRRSLKIQLDAAEEVFRKLQHEQTLREKFISMLAHDLRTPLTGSRLIAELLMKTHPEEKLNKSLKRIVSSISRADKMISDLLDANRIEAGKPVPLDITHFSMLHLINETVSDLKSLYGDRFVIKCEEDSTGEWSYDGLRRVIENLSSNAVKYGEATTPITIRLARLQDKVSLSVHNFGPALSPKEQEVLFMQYHRSETAEQSGKKGWGIGLTLVQGIAHAHGGDVKVESIPVSGTTFTVILPLDARSENNAADVELTSGNILIIDDTEASRYVMVKSLRVKGYVISEAQSGNEGLELARAIKPALIILDMQLPDMNGMEVMKILKNDPLTSKIPIIQTSAIFTRDEDRHQGLQMGASDYLFQPIDPKTLLSKVSNLLK